MARWYHERVACSVLVVDDDPAFRELAARVLTGWDHLVVGEAGTVAEALQRASELRPDAALVDIGLPDGDGFALTDRLVRPPWAPPLVLISAGTGPPTAPAAPPGRGHGVLGHGGVFGDPPPH